MISLFYFFFLSLAKPDYSNFDVQNKVITIRECPEGESPCIITQEDYQKSGPFNTYKSIVIAYGPTEIASNAFLDSRGLETVEISSWITKIEVPFCRGCSNLKSIKIKSENPNFFVDNFGNLYQRSSNTLLRAPPALQFLNLTNNVVVLASNSFHSSKCLTKISGGTFYDSLVQTITFDPESIITSIESSAMAIQYSLRSVRFPSSVVNVSNDAIADCEALQTVTFPSGSKLINIGAKCFSNCKSLTEILLPDSVECIDGDAFSSCSSLVNVQLSLNLRFVSPSAFSGCNSIKNVILPTQNEFYKILNGALYDKSMTQVIIIPTTVETFDIPTTLTEIGLTALQLCPLLTKLNIPDSHQKYLNNDQMLIDKNTKTVLAFVGGIKEVIFPDGMIALSSYCAYKCMNLTTVNVPESVTTLGSFCFSESSISVITLPGVSTINAKAFENCNSLSSITFIQDGQLFLGDSTFKDCDHVFELHFFCSVSIIPYRFCKRSGVTKIIFEKDGFNHLSEAAFEDTYSLESIVFPSSLQTLTKSSFSNSAVKSVSFPNGCGITVVEVNAFGNCMIEEIEFGDSLTTLQSSVFANCKYLNKIILSDNCPLSELTLSDIFFNCTNLKTFNIPKNVNSIDPSIFFGCSNLTEITAHNNPNFISENGIIYDIQNAQKILVVCPPGLADAKVANDVSALGPRCFYGCTLLYTVNFTSTTKFTEIGESVFFGCSSLNHLTIPAIVSTISGTAFTECRSLRDVIFENGSSLSSLGSGIFSTCSSLYNINLEECKELESIPENCFASCSQLKKIKIPVNVTKLEISSFQDCSSISSVIFESIYSLKSISDLAFKGCSSLKSINFPISLESIGESAFEGSGLFDKITIPTDIQTVSRRAFSKCPMKHIIYCGKNLLENNALEESHAIVHVTPGYPANMCMGVVPVRDVSPDCYIATANPVNIVELSYLVGQCIISGIANGDETE